MQRGGGVERSGVGALGCFGALLFVLLPPALVGQECELAGLTVPEHGILNEHCAGLIGDGLSLPDGGGCYISCEDGWIESGDQPACAGGELRNAVTCSQLLLPCLRSLLCLRSKDRGCINSYEDRRGPGTCNTDTIGGTLTAIACTTDYCRTCDYQGECDAACESIIPAEPGMSFCVPDDETVQVSITQHFSFRHYDTRGVSGEELTSAGIAAFSSEGGDEYDGGVRVLATQQRLNVVVEVGRRVWSGSEGIASYSSYGMALAEAETACALAAGLADFASLPAPAELGWFAATAGENSAAASVIARNETGGTLTLTGSLLVRSEIGELLADRQLYPRLVLALSLALEVSDVDSLQVRTHSQRNALLHPLWTHARVSLNISEYTC